jgi:hypothetical protein
MTEILPIWLGVINLSRLVGQQGLINTEKEDKDKEEEYGDERGEGGRGNVRNLGMNMMKNSASKMKYFWCWGTVFVDTKEIPMKSENETGKLSSRWSSKHPCAIVSLPSVP